MEVGHIINKRIRLLINDHGPDGYWIWQCLIDRAYGLYGYYFPVTGDDIDLISADVCRKPPEVVWAVIESTVKRGLFDQNIFSKQSVLTNDKMQLNFIRGTFDRRRKGGIVYFEDKYFLLSVNELHGIGEQYLDRVIFKDTGLNLRQKIDSDCGKTLFSTGKENNSGVPQLIPPENSEIPLLKRKRKRKINRNTIHNTVDAEAASPVVGIKNGEISSLAKNSRVVKEKKFTSAETELGNRIMVRWMSWFEERNKGARPKFGVIEGKAIKNIYKHFLTVARKEDFIDDKMIYDFAFDEFSLILSQWENLSGNSYLYSSVDIKKISHNLNEIINYLNNGHSSNQKLNYQTNGKSTGAHQLLDDIKKMGKGRV